MNQLTRTDGGARALLISGVVLALSASTLLAGCAQKGPTSTSETVAGTSSGAGSTTEPGTGGIDPNGAATTSPGDSTGGQLLKFTVNGQDYSSISPYVCMFSGGTLVSSGAESSNDGPSFSVLYTVGEEADAVISVTTPDFFGMMPADGTRYEITYDPSTAAYSVSGTMMEWVGSNTASIEISGTCK